VPLAILTRTSKVNPVASPSEAPVAAKPSQAAPAPEAPVAAKPTPTADTNHATPAAPKVSPTKVTTPEAPAAPKPSQKKVSTALPQESQVADTEPMVKPDLSKSPNLNSYLFGGDSSSGGGGDDLSSLISKVHDLEQAPVRPVASLSETAAQPAAQFVATPSWAKPMAGDPIQSRPSASLLSEETPYVGDSSTYTNDPDVLKTLRLGRFTSPDLIQNSAKHLADQEWAATAMSDQNSALSGFLGASGGAARIAKPTLPVFMKKKSRKVIIKEDMSQLDKIMGKLR